MAKDTEIKENQEMDVNNDLLAKINEAQKELDAKAVKMDLL